MKKIMSFGRLKSNKRLSIDNIDNRKAVSLYFPTFQYNDVYFYSQKNIILNILERFSLKKYINCLKEKKQKILNYMIFIKQRIDNPINYLLFHLYQKQN